MFLDQRLSGMDDQAGACPPGNTWQMSGDISGCHNQDGTIAQYLVVEARDVAKQPIMCKTSTDNKELMDPDCQKCQS